MPSSRDTFLCFLLIAILATFPAYAAPTSEPAGAAQRSPVPKSLEQQRAEKVILKRFATEYADRDPSARLALSHKLREAATEPALDDSMRFVLLREARERAIDAGNLGEALSVIDEMNRGYAIDARNMKVSAMSVAMDKALVPPAELAATYLKLADDFLGDGDLDMGKKATQLASDIAHSSRDATLRVRVAEAEKALLAARKYQNQTIESAQKLRKDPHDSDAALRVGLYLCQVREQWTQGLPMLAIGTDSKLKVLAAQELAPPATAEAMATVADGWWTYAQTLNGPTARKIKTHASHWYEEALPKLQGDAKSTAAARINEIKEATGK